jgi:hypothetical protein
VAETSGLLNRRTGYSRTEGSNPSVSAKASFASGLAVKDGRNVLPVETQNESDVREAQQALTARL